MNAVYGALEYFFWRTLRCRPDGGPLHAWWYHHTSNIARYFHRKKGCEVCAREGWS